MWIVDLIYLRRINHRPSVTIKSRTLIKLEREFRMFNLNFTVLAGLIYLWPNLFKFGGMILLHKYVGRQCATALKTVQNSVIPIDGSKTFK